MEFKTMNRKPSEVEQSAAPVGQIVEPPEGHAPKFTPGPWRISDHNNLEVHAHGELLAIAFPMAPELQGSGYHEARANANLIAAAPDLYEALEAIVTGERGPLLLGEPEMIERMERGRRRMENARAALANARGAPVLASQRDDGRWLCTCHSHQFVTCRGKENLGAGWACADEVEAGRAAIPTAGLEKEKADGV